VESGWRQKPWRWARGAQLPKGGRGSNRISSKSRLYRILREAGKVSGCNFLQLVCDLRYSVTRKLPNGKGPGPSSSRRGLNRSGTNERFHHPCAFLTSISKQKATQHSNGPLRLTVLVSRDDLKLLGSVAAHSSRVRAEVIKAPMAVGKQTLARGPKTADECGVSSRICRRLLLPASGSFRRNLRAP